MFGAFFFVKLFFFFIAQRRWKNLFERTQKFVEFLLTLELIRKWHFLDSLSRRDCSSNGTVFTLEQMKSKLNFCFSSQRDLESMRGKIGAKHLCIFSSYFLLRLHHMMRFFHACLDSQIKNIFRRNQVFTHSICVRFYQLARCQSAKNSFFGDDSWLNNSTHRKRMKIFKKTTKKIYTRLSSTSSCQSAGTRLLLSTTEKRLKIFLCCASCEKHFFFFVRNASASASLELIFLYFVWKQKKVHV